MGQNKLVRVFFLTTIILSACLSKNENYFRAKMNASLKEQREKFGLDYTKHNLLEHFPKDIMKSGISLQVSEPSCPPSYSCSAQRGSVFLICKVDSIKNIKSDLHLLHTKYNSDSLIIIDLHMLYRDGFNHEKCNKWFAGKVPVPCFENFDFGLGKYEGKEKHNDVKYKLSTYTIPDDLFVYVISAESGNFWKVPCYEKRPEVLKEWQNGYSTGFAFSEKHSLMIFWTMIW